MQTADMEEAGAVGRLNEEIRKLKETGENALNIDDLTLGEIRQLQTLLSRTPSIEPSVASDKIGKYVIVRCKDAGVHAGVLTSANGRSCSLTGSRRLWYWKPANGAAFLSGVATEGLDPSSKVGAAVDIDLTENCEIIACSQRAVTNIKAHPDYRP